MTDIQKDLFALADKEYAAFQAKLTPGVEADKIIGVRVPILRDYAKKMDREAAKEFLSSLPHKYYDENILHSVLLSKSKDYNDCIVKINEFLPFVDNWAVCDILSPKVFKKHTAELLPTIEGWISSDETYTCRFGIEMLMSFYLDNEFKKEYNLLPAKVISDEYYVNMMIAWYFATALAKQWDDTIEILTSNVLPKWAHNKTIQKARESYRITAEQKEFLKGIKRC